MNNFLLVGVLIFLLFDHYIPKRDKLIILSCIVLSFILNLVEISDSYFYRPENQHFIYARLITSWTGYICRPILLWGLWELLRGTKRKIIRHLFVLFTAVNILLHSTCFFSGLVFGYDPVTFKWFRGPLGYTSHVTMVLMMLLFIPTLIEMFFNNIRSDFWAGLSSLLLVLLATLYDTFYNHSVLIYVINYEIILYFLFLHISLEQEFTQAKIREYKSEMMLMQIKPHFINNTLSTIQALCEIDPQLASRTTGTFAKYLRANLTVMDKPLPVPVEEELDHVKAYLEIEMLRFPWIHVDYDIQDTDFNVPALSIQPLAENAVQHGLRKVKKGNLLIRTRRTDTGHIIEIIDDGAGFDTSAPKIEKDHGIGTQNVKYRIEEMCHGTLGIESTVGEGTTVTVFIP